MQNICPFRNQPTQSKQNTYYNLKEENYDSKNHSYNFGTELLCDNGLDTAFHRRRENTGKQKRNMRIHHRIHCMCHLRRPVHWTLHRSWIWRIRGNAYKPIAGKEYRNWITSDVCWILGRYVHVCKP